MAPRIILALAPSFSLRRVSRTEVSVQSRMGEQKLSGLTAGLRGALDLLAEGDSTDVELATSVLEADGDSAVPLWYHHLHTIRVTGGLRYSVGTGEEALAVLIPISPNFEGRFPPVGNTDGFVFSRFASLRLNSGLWVIESPMSLARVHLLEPEAIPLIERLGRRATAGDVAAAVPGTSGETAVAFLTLLAGERFITEVDGEGKSGEERDENRILWEAPDLLFHSRSRLGRHDNAFGGTFRFLTKVDPAPALKAPMSSDTIDLFAPDMDSLKTGDPPFSKVLETRRSIREHDSDSPIDIGQLGEFLFRVGRVKRVIPSAETDSPQDLTMRPSPSGGACHSLELYPAVRECGGLPSGLYHYDPLGHRLEGLSATDDHLQRLLEDAQIALHGAESPQVLIVIAARFPRVMWKYQSVAYSLILKDVGVLFQTMYLVATAMGLAPCALGGGDSELFARTIGTQFYEETSVGEFALGTRPPS